VPLALLDPPLGVRQRLPTPLGSAQLLGQLIAPRLAVKLVFTAVGLLSPTQDLPHHARVRAVLIIDALALILVPSTMIIPTDTRPASRHSPST
jgi:hypothetical protein